MRLIFASTMDELPEVNLEELAEEMALNRRQRMEFVMQYAEWLKTPNPIWSRQQNCLLG